MLVTVLVVHDVDVTVVVTVVWADAGSGVATKPQNTLNVVRAMRRTTFLLLSFVNPATP